MIVIIPLIIVVGIIGWALRPGVRPSNPRKVAILAIVVPALAVAIAAVIFQVLHNTTGTIEVAEIANTLFVVGLGLIAASILAAFGYALLHQGDIARGMGFGACIAVIISVIELGLLEWLAGV